ncbi:hypothetical protein HanXRQr2_Chr11g0494671 [Helianthus annuus]|uniref:Uncharacterized protein n=1 Tax=Helianthus annuus TaxID=4232 RepID=A0A9K3HPI9_HELAN|nr:hypothetical protein HanXRQr2_Chr11g0494671 [Helianthus annuus]KAJ0875456.1 hypothetical protein HanPSC8_Chr11g0476651 [Helianthus annuus]
MVQIRRFRHQYGFERPEAPHSLRNSHLQSYTSSSSSSSLLFLYFDLHRCKTSALVVAMGI